MKHLVDVTLSPSVRRSDHSSCDGFHIYQAAHRATEENLSAYTTWRLRGYGYTQRQEQSTESEHAK